LTNESDKIQIKTLKDDIKALKAKVKDLETFGGQVKDINEFVYLLNQILIVCKAKTKEQKDALSKITNVFNNYQGMKLNI
jgi:predicted GNAT family acetyltransferase